jgi:hypothetical protein
MYPVQHSRRPLVLAAFTFAVCLAVFRGALQARACTLDQRPSALADGRLAVANQQTVTNSALLAVWAPFVFPQHFSTRRTVTLWENRAEVARSLTDAAMRTPWRWQFGDGAVSYGWTVHHRWARAAEWRIDVAAYDPGTKRWYSFDQVDVQVAR